MRRKNSSKEIELPSTRGLTTMLWITELANMVIIDIGFS